MKRTNPCSPSSSLTTFSSLLSPCCLYCAYWRGNVQYRPQFSMRVSSSFVPSPLQPAFQYRWPSPWSSWGWLNSQSTSVIRRQSDRGALFLLLVLVISCLCERRSTGGSSHAHRAACRLGSEDSAISPPCQAFVSMILFRYRISAFHAEGGARYERPRKCGNGTTGLVREFKVNSKLK